MKFSRNFRSNHGGLRPLGGVSEALIFCVPRLFCLAALLIALCGLGPRHVPKTTEQDIYSLPGLTLWLDSSDFDSYNRENLLLQSEDLTTSWNAVRGAFTANSVANPVDGAVTADTFDNNSTETNSRYFYQNIAITSGVVYEQSAWVKQKDLGYAYFRLIHSTDDSTVIFNLSDCSVSSNADSLEVTTDSVGNSWCYFAARKAAPSTQANGYGVFGHSSGVAENFAGSSGDGTYWFGMHMRRASTSSKYVPTTTAAVNGVSSTRTVERWYSKVGSIYFENTTAAEQPVRTLPTNNENQLTSSEAYNSATRAKVRRYLCDKWGADC